MILRVGLRYLLTKPITGPNAYRSQYPPLALVTRAMSSEAQPSPVQGAKKDARKQFRSALKGLTDEQMRHESATITRLVTLSEWYRSAKTLALYIHAPQLREVDTSMLIDDALTASKKVFVPRVDDRSANMTMLHIETLEGLERVQPFNILEPSDFHPDGRRRETLLQADGPIDVLLIPGLGFDLEGGRLGRGGGYYDNMLQKVLDRNLEKGWPRPKIVALAYGCQVLGEGLQVPRDAHDVLIDCLVTAEGMREFS